MSISKLGKRLAVGGGAVVSVVGLVAAAPFLGPVGVVVIGGLEVGEALGLAGGIAGVIGGLLSLGDDEEE